MRSAEPQPDEVLPSRLRTFGPAIVVGVIALGAFTAGMWYLVVRHAVDDAQGNWELAAEPILRVTIPALALIALIYAWVMVLSARTRARNQLLRDRFPDSLVLPSGRVPQLVRALGAPGLVEMYGHEASGLPYGLSLMISGDGIDIWAGSPRDPSIFLSVPWSDIVDVRATNVAEFARSSRGLVFELRAADSGDGLPFIILGKGLGGLFPVSSSAIDRIRTEVWGMRPGITPA